MTYQVPTIASLENAGEVTPSDLTHAPERVVEIAGERLESPASLNSAIDTILSHGLYQREDIEEAFACLIAGHLLLTGPPGTGKTELARQLAKSFNVVLLEGTANPEWSVYDIVGSPALPGSDPPYRDGILTRAIIHCANNVVAHLDNNSGPQGAWLLIDEINRAEIDRAFGPLFTALSSADSGAFELDHRPNNPLITIPSRFRIIATMNSFDTRFVNTMSAALRRRFSRVVILPPPNHDGESSLDELNLALARADTLVTSRLNLASGSLEAMVRPFSSDIRAAVGAVRGLDEHGGVPVGTAQVIDTCVLLLTLIAIRGEAIDQTVFDDLLDRALSSRLVNSLESDAARLRLRPTFSTAFAKRFPMLRRSSSRLTSFLSGND